MTINKSQTEGYCLITISATVVANCYEIKTEKLNEMLSKKNDDNCYKELLTVKGDNKITTTNKEAFKTKAFIIRKNYLIYEENMEIHILSNDIFDANNLLRLGNYVTFKKTDGIKKIQTNYDPFKEIIKKEDGYYQITVSGLGDSFVEAAFYDVKLAQSPEVFSSSDSDVINGLNKLIVSQKYQRRELSLKKARGRQEVIVRDYRIIKKDDKNFAILANEIVDSDNLSHLGHYVLFSGDKTIKCNSTKIDPPHNLPLPNNTFLCIRGSNEDKIDIRVHDLKEGEFSYQTRSIILHGVDLRLQGNEIEYRKNEIILKPFESSDKSTETRKEQDKNYKKWIFKQVENCNNWIFVPLFGLQLSNSSLLDDDNHTKDNYLLIVKGGGMNIEGVRAGNIDEVRITSSKEFKTQVETIVEKKKNSSSSALLQRRVS